MFRSLPNKKDNKWLKLSVLIFIVLLILISIINIVFLDINWSEINFTEEILPIIILSLLPSLIIGLSGYFGAKIIPNTMFLGIILALGFMINFTRKSYELSGLVGGIAFFDIIIASFGVGIIAEIILYFVKK